MTQGIMGNILRVVPPLLGRRSLAGGKSERRRTVNDDEAALRSTIEQARGTARFGSSPGVCRA
jgi:hypothetical protein